MTTSTATAGRRDLRRRRRPPPRRGGRRQPQRRPGNDSSPAARDATSEGRTRPRPHPRPRWPARPRQLRQWNRHRDRRPLGQRVERLRTRGARLAPRVTRGGGRRLRAPIAARSLACARMTERATTPQEIEPALAGVWADEHTWEVSNDPDERPKSYVLEMLPYPSGEPHIGHLKTYSVGDAIAHFHRRTGPACCTRWATTRSACRPRTTRSRPASTRATRPRRRSPPSSASSASGGSRSTGRASSAPTSRATTAGPSGSSCKLFERGPGLPQGGGRQVVPQRRDRAGQRAGHRRALRALRRRGRGAPARAVVLPHHRLRRPPARRPRHDRLARARQDDAAQLDRALRGRRGDLPLRGAGASTTRSSPRGPTRCSARPSSSWRPSTPTCCAWPPAPSTSRRCATTSTTR